MIWITTAITFVRSTKWAQYALAGVALIIAAVIFFAIHDANVRKAQIEQMQRDAAVQAEKNAKVADKNQEKRDDAFNESEAGLRNSAGVDDYLTKLRAETCRKRPTAC